MKITKALLKIVIAGIFAVVILCGIFSFYSVDPAAYTGGSPFIYGEY